MTDPAPQNAANRVDLAEEQDFDLGGMSVHPAECAVEQDGKRQELQPRVMQVLVALAKARPAVISRDRLIEQCWDGRIVGDDALNRCILALRHVAQEFTPPPFAIETVPRVGHRLLVASEPRAPKAGTPRRWLPAAMLALLLAAAGLFFWQQRGRSAEPASIAVLPFRSLGTGDPYFAEGIGEEILGQLAREPQFRVAGNSSSSQLGANARLSEVADRLDVDYVVEGSVRRQGDQVRVNAGLVRARDGMRLWTDSYDGKLDDIFAIQRQIGGAIAGALKRKLVRAPSTPDHRATSGEAYDLYLTARGLLRTNNRRIGPTAIALLEDATRIDPNYAPAWARLAYATQLEGALHDHERYIAAVRKARGYAQRSVRLAPDLPEAHQALGETYGFGDPEGIAHFRRAAELAPNSAEGLLNLADALAASGEFGRQLAACRRAHEIEPLWYRTTGVTAMAMAAMGDRAGAEAFARRDLPDKGANLQVLLGRVAWVFGDYSEAARRWDRVARANSPRWGHVALRTLHDATHAVGIDSGPLENVPQPISARSNWRVWMDAPPTPAEWRKRNRDPIAAEAYRGDNLVAAKLMLSAGRWRELAGTYDSRVGLFGLRPGQHVRTDQVREATLAALALRQAGRGAEADRLLREADAAVRAAFRRGQAPMWFDADAAALFAAEGRRDEALSTIARALDRGWRQNGSADLIDINDEPAFRPLHGDARFERVRARLAAHYAREKQEVLQLRLGVRSRP